MFHSILVPLDISESRLTHQVIPYVQANAAIDNASVHFLTVIPSYLITRHWGWLIRLKRRNWRRYSSTR
jgi:hypothetical protein